MGDGGSKGFCYPSFRGKLAHGLPGNAGFEVGGTTLGKLLQIVALVATVLERGVQLPQRAIGCRIWPERQGLAYRTRKGP